MNTDLEKLQPYPFEKLARLKAGRNSASEKKPIMLSIGEPKHATPELISSAISANLQGLSSYPTTKGIAELRNAIASWLVGRFALPQDSIDPEQHVLPVNGTREALFAFAQAIVDRNAVQPTVMMPNPFYQIYEGAALLSGATPYFMDCTADNGYLPDFDAVEESTWQACQLIYICTPGNPTGAVIDQSTLQKLIRLSDQYDFVIASDECYSEIYFDTSEPPVGLLQAANAMGRNDYKNCVVFHSLSKRSNAPGLRSGFVAGDAAVLQQFLRYRTYHGCAMPVQHQLASIAAWTDEQHVVANRQLYQQKFETVLPILGDVLDVKMPQAGFYLWPQVPQSDEIFAKELFIRENITLLPGSFLSRDNRGSNPGSGHVRMALVAPLADCVDAAERIRHFCTTFC